MMQKLLALVCALRWTLWFFLGASVFSFAGTAARRLPRGERILWSRSRCPHCGRVLGPAELIPCLSYLVLRGKCRGCGGKIPARDFWVEAGGGLCVCAAVLRWGGGTARFWVTVPALALLAMVALTDYDTREIADRFHLLLLLCGTAAIWAFPETGMVERLIGCAALSVPMLAIALLIPGGFGGGDIKLAFALGFLLGWRDMLCAAFLAFCAAGGWCIPRLARKRVGWKEEIAFGPFLCAGAAIAMFYGEEIVGWWRSLG